MSSQSPFRLYWPISPSLDLAVAFFDFFVKFNASLTSQVTSVCMQRRVPVCVCLYWCVCARMGSTVP